jgi:hypothetical protein
MRHCSVLADQLLPEVLFSLEFILKLEECQFKSEFPASSLYLNFYLTYYYKPQRHKAHKERTKSLFTLDSDLFFSNPL